MQSFIDQFDQVAVSSCPAFWVYDLSMVNEKAQKFRNACKSFSEITGVEVVQPLYATKANMNLEIIKVLSTHTGFEVTSFNELIIIYNKLRKNADFSSFAAEKIFVEGLIKTEEFIRYAIYEVGVRNFSIESEQDLIAIKNVLASGNRIFSINLFFRINPSFVASTNSKIATGGKNHKFGIHPDSIPALLSIAEDLPVRPVFGIHFHIGSQLTNLSDFSSVQNIFNLIDDFRSLNGETPTPINFGGGFPVSYSESVISPQEILEYIAILFAERFSSNNFKIYFEPGRCLVAEAGTLVSKVLHVRKDRDYPQIIIAASMANLIRPALYGSYHKISAITSSYETKNTEVCGSACETGDTFGFHQLPQLNHGEWVLIHNAGAYGESMSSGYNGMPELHKFYIR